MADAKSSPYVSKLMRMTQASPYPLDDAPAGSSLIFENKMSLCWCGVAGWCAHVQRVIQSDEDRLIDMMREAPQGVVAIPLFPKYRIWCDVDWEELGRDHFKLTISEEVVILHSPDPEDNFLGIVGAGDGRRVVRLMILDWFKARTPDQCSCTSGVHGWREEREWQAHKNDLTYKVASAWSIVWTGSCIPCNEKGAAAYADLIPEVADGNNFPRRWNNGRLEYT